MDMIAMLAGLGGPTDMWQSNSGGGYTPSLNKTSGGSSGSSYGSTYLRNTGGGKSGASVSGQTVDQYLAGKGLAQDLPALPKPVTVSARAPYGPQKLSEKDFLAKIGLPEGRVPSVDAVIAAAQKKARDYVAVAGQNGAEITKRKQILLRYLLLGVGLKGVMDLWEIQMANKAIVEMARQEPWFNDKAEDYIEEQQNRYGGLPMKHAGARAVYDLDNASHVFEVLRNMAAQREVLDPAVPTGATYWSVSLKTLNIKPRVGAGGSSAYRENLMGLGAIPGGWQPLRDKINQDPYQASGAIVSAGVFFSNPRGTNTRWSAESADVAKAIAEGVIVRLYSDAAVQLKAWRDARNDYLSAKAMYDQRLKAWEKRENYRKARIDATKEYWEAFGKEAAARGDKKTKEAADSKKREEDAKKAAEDANRSLRESQEANQKLQDKLGELEQTIKDLNDAASTGDSAAATEAKALIDALKAEIDQLKKDLVDAQNAAVEAARNANQNASGGGGGGGGFVTTDTSQSAADATQAATDATQIAADALQQTGETVTFKPPEAKKGGSGMLLVLGAVAVGGYLWWRSRRPARPSLMP